MTAASFSDVAEMTEYERRRLENIKRNDDMLAALKIRSKLTDLSAATASAKCQSVLSKSIGRSPVKKPKIETPVVLRRSLRRRGVQPNAPAANGRKIKRSLNKYAIIKCVPKEFTREQGPLVIKDAYRGGNGLDNTLMEKILGSSRDSLLNGSGAVSCDSIDSMVKTEVPDTSKTGKKVWGSVDVKAFQLEPENKARVVTGRITSMRFFPSRNMQLIAVGNNFGDVGFWHIDCKEEEGGGIHAYHSHSGHVSGIVIDSFSISKMYSSSYDGCIRLMEVEKGVFTMVYHSEYYIYSLSLNPHDRSSLYFSRGKDGFNKWDVRAGKSCLSCILHDDRINTIDFNSENENIMATSSTDGTACIWDLRLMNKDKITPLTTISHNTAVHSAYFSPSGKFLATTSTNDKVGLSSGANYENTCMVGRRNHVSSYSSRGIWGWDDSYVYVGNTKRGVDVISVARQKVVATLESDLLSAIPIRLDAHPYNLGMLAGASVADQVYIWTHP